MTAIPDKRAWKPDEREKWPLNAGFTRNQGVAPRKAKGKRAIVYLMSGEIAGDTPVTTVSPAGWAIETTRWTLTGFWGDVDQYRLV